MRYGLMILLIFIILFNSAYKSKKSKDGFITFSKITTNIKNTCKNKINSIKHNVKDKFFGIYKKYLIT